MTDTKTNRFRWMSPVLLLAAVATGVVLGQLLPSALLDLRTPTVADTDESAPFPEGQLWTCGMHPHVIEEQPGQCPICGMDLTPMRDNSGGSEVGHSHPERSPSSTTEPAAWTCPDHANIVESQPGTCPIDSLDLVPADTPPGEREILFYRNPMDPTVTSPVPAKDSMGMEYVAVYAPGADAAEPASGVVRVDPATVQKMNVRIEKVVRRDLTHPIRTVGYLEFDQERMVTVTTKYSGWIEKVYVNYVGENVRRGQPLFEIYSPELVQTEQELLSALEFATAMSDAPEDARQRALSMVDSARVRLSYWDISPQQIERLEDTGEVFRTLEVTAPADGQVMKRLAGLEGMAVQPGMELFHIADLSSLWLSVELFEGQLAWVSEGTTADIVLPYFPGESFRGRVRFLEPELSEKTRTMRAKIEMPNPRGRLRKGMYATVELQPVVVHQALAVPTQAVLRTGTRNVVMQAIGEGSFVPREVSLGQEAGGFVEILEGLDQGAQVVTSAQFLLDSESTLQAAIQKMIAGRGER